MELPISEHSSASSTKSGAAKTSHRTPNGGRGKYYARLRPGDRNFEEALPAAVVGAERDFAGADPFGMTILESEVSAFGGAASDAVDGSENFFAFIIGGPS